MTSSNPAGSSTAATASAGPRPGPLAWTLFLLTLGALALAVGIAAAVTVSTYRVMEVTQREAIPEWVWPLAHVGGTALAAGLLAVIALSWRVAPVRSYATGLAGLAALAALLGTARLVDVNADGLRAALTGLVAILGGAAGLLLGRGRGRSVWRPAAIGLAIAASVLLATPWLMFGALDSWGRLIGNAVAALLVGLATSVWLTRFVFDPTETWSGNRRTGLLLAGFVAAVGLLLVGTSIGANGLQLVYAPPLAALGWLAAWLDRTARDRKASGLWAVAVLIAIVLAAALWTFDPEEQGLYLLDDGVGLWATAASLTAATLALIVGLLMAILDGGWGARIGQRPAVSWALAAFAVVVAGSSYALLGHPGLYGEQLFVIMRDQADLSRVDPGLDQKARASAVYAELTTLAEDSQSDLRATLDGLGIGYRPYYLVNALEVDGGGILRLYLLTRPDVAEVLMSQHLRPVFREGAVAQGNEPAPTGPEWNLTQIGVDRVWSELGVTGAGIVVGQSDSGVDGDHPAIAAQYRGSDDGDNYNWLDPWEGTASPTDHGGHGTHTLGTILGTGGIGVAPDAEWFACRNLARNLGNPALYLECMEFMLAPYPADGNSLRDGNPALGAHVINNSWGCPPIEGCDPSSLGPAVAALRTAGIFVVASAGNDGPRCSTVVDPIAIYDGAFSVAAIDSFGELADFSSRGPVPADGLSKPDIAAPGVAVLSSMPGGTYTSNSGTSMAGPHIVGVVALMWSANPALIGDIDTTERLIRETAAPYTGQLTAPNCDLAAHPEWAVGAGVVDAFAAVQAAQRLGAP